MHLKMISLPEKWYICFQQTKQVHFALFKRPWLAALIESLRLDSRPSRQLKAGPSAMYACRWRRHLCGVWNMNAGFVLEHHVQHGNLTVSTLTSTSRAQGELHARWRRCPAQYGDGIAWAMMESLWPRNQQLERSNLLLISSVLWQDFLTGVWAENWSRKRDSDELLNTNTTVQNIQI